MAVRDWQPWQFGTLWVVSLVVLVLLLRRATSSFSGSSASGGIASGSVAILPGLLAVLVLVGLVTVTVRWMRRAG